MAGQMAAAGFNAQKCHVMRITHTRKPFLQQYKLNGVILEEKKSHTYLGVDLCKDLTWNTHVDRICSKANRTIGFLQRNLHDCPTHIKDMSYKTLVRPILDYCSSVWDPYTQTLTKQIEAVQNRAARFVTGDESQQTKQCHCNETQTQLGTFRIKTKSGPANQLSWSYCWSPRHSGAVCLAPDRKESQTHLYNK